MDSPVSAFGVGRRKWSCTERYSFPLNSAGGNRSLPSTFSAPPDGSGAGFHPVDVALRGSSRAAKSSLRGAVKCSLRRPAGSPRSSPIRTHLSDFFRRPSVQPPQQHFAIADIVRTRAHRHDFPRRHIHTNVQFAPRPPLTHPRVDAPSIPLRRTLSPPSNQSPDAAPHSSGAPVIRFLTAPVAATTSSDRGRTR